MVDAQDVSGRPTTNHKTGYRRFFPPCRILEESTVPFRLLFLVFPNEHNPSSVAGIRGLFVAQNPRPLATCRHEEKDGGMDVKPAQCVSLSGGTILRWWSPNPQDSPMSSEGRSVLKLLAHWAEALACWTSTDFEARAAPFFPAPGSAESTLLMAGKSSVFGFALGEVTEDGWILA